MKIIKKVGVACIKDNCLLLIKNKGVSKYIIPVGSCLDGENDFDALFRGVKKDLQADIDFKSIRFIGTYQHKSAGLSGCQEQISFYAGNIIAPIRHANEIEEVIWFNPRTNDFDELSSIVRDRVIPDLFSKGMLS